MILKRPTNICSSLLQMSTNDEKPMLKQDADKEEKTPEEVEWESRIRLTPQFNQLIQANLEADVIFEMFKLIERGMFTFEDVDEIVRVTITRFTRKQGIQFFKVLGAKDFTHIMRKSHYIVSQMKLFKYYIDQKATIFNGPDQKKVQELLDRTGYSLKVTTGMRQYGGPPPEWDGESPLHREISISKVPDDWYEDKLVPVLEKYGKIYELRIMIDNITGLTRNFCFVKYCDEQDNLNALSKIDNLWIPFEQDNKNKLEIEGGVTLKANFSTCNKRLFVGNVPKTETKDGFIKTFSQFVEGIEDAEVYVSDEMVKVGLENRGFVFLEFKSHNQAAEGKRVLAGIGEKVYEGNMLKVEWAEPAYCPSAEETAKVKAIHVSNLSREVTEDLLRSTFERYGKLFHVQKVRDYAFIHYDERESALKALDEAKDLELCGFKIKVNISTSGPLMRKIKKQNKLAWLRGEFGFGKKKERQAPPPPRRGPCILS
ncbi:hypothetical protein DPMN_181080 [Dreissena polymorpha]|uniref:RRM domain-containing protein n=1 Tax=Dreissena polymorpha TaxID=45954 RepID=A0A9D4DDS2_DREPO|nr:hypothetical protein DPMN_181080 [Dreissena polymorpha]